MIYEYEGPNRRNRMVIVKLLMEAGADPDAENRTGRTPRDYVDSLKKQHAGFDHKEVLRLLDETKPKPTGVSGGFFQ